MIWIPQQTPSEEIRTGLWWSSIPDRPVEPGGHITFMEFDKLQKPVPLPNHLHQFVKDYWAVTRAVWDDTPDCFQSFTSFDIVVSAEIATVIEKLEPGLHDIIEIPRMWSLSSGREITRKFCFLHVYQTAKTIDLERSNAFKRIRPSTKQEYYYLQAMTPEDCVVLPGPTKTRHLWRDEIIPSEAFMSDRLKSEIEKLGVRGFKFLATTAKED